VSGANEPARWLLLLLLLASSVAITLHTGRASRPQLPGRRQPATPRAAVA